MKTRTELLNEAEARLESISGGADYERATANSLLAIACTLLAQERRVDEERVTAEMSDAYVEKVYAIFRKHGGAWW